MSDQKVIDLLQKLAKQKDINISYVNDEIKSNFPTMDFGTSKNLLRPFVEKILTTLDKTKLEKAFIAINTIFAICYPNHKTLDSILTKSVRKIISEKYGVSSKEHVMSKKLVKISFVDKKNLIKEATDKVFSKNANRNSFESEEIIEAIKDNINAEDPMRKIVALSMASGSRPIELLDRAGYSQSPIGTNWVIQDYVAKSKEKGKTVTKPIIYLTAGTFIRGVDEARRELNAQYGTLIDKKGELKSVLSQRATKIMKEIFQQDITWYMTRKQYVNMSYDLYSKTADVFGKNLSPGVWSNLVLGHQENSLSTTHNYSHVEIKTPSVTPKDMAARQEILENKVEDIEERIEDIPHVNKQASKETVLKIKKIFDDYKKDNGKDPSLTTFQKLAKDVATRAVIRQFYKTF